MSNQQVKFSQSSDQQIGMKGDICQVDDNDNDNDNDNDKSKSKSVQVFNEKSKFLIFRPTELIDEGDYGWYILRGLGMDFRRKILDELKDDAIIDFDIGEQSFFVTTTTMEDQNKMNYLVNKRLLDLVLFPDEKRDMCFELINSN